MSPQAAKIFQIQNNQLFLQHTGINTNAAENNSKILAKWEGFLAITLNECNPPTRHSKSKSSS